MKLTLNTLESLPDTIELVGFGLTKQVFLGGVALTNAYPIMVKAYGTEFNWGMLSAKSKALAFAVLNTFMSPGEAMWLTSTFQHHFIAEIRETVTDSNEHAKVPTSTFNFKLLIDLKKWYGAVMNSKLPETGSKPIDWFKAYSKQVAVEIPTENYSMPEATLSRIKQVDATDIVITPMSEDDFRKSQPSEE